MSTVKDLFTMSNEALLEAWRVAKVDELEARIARRLANAQTALERQAIEQAKVNDERKLETELIRLVISFRLMGREVEGDAKRLIVLRYWRFLSDYP